jgi:hypothetical protein
MVTYNGFTGQQRAKAQAWLRAQWKSGAVLRPTQCCACGQTEGPIDSHAEDYSQPFGPHLYAFPLCYFCHMMVHCRHRATERFDAYCAAIARGLMAEARGRDFSRVTSFLDQRSPSRVAFVPAPSSWHRNDVLGEIANGAYDPRTRSGTFSDNAI